MYNYRHEFILPVKSGRPEGYGGRGESFPWPRNVHEVPAEAVASTPLDCILFQSRKNYLVDQHEILTPAQRELPRIYLEHDPPREHPTDTRHPVDDPAVLLVHVTEFNRLMWDTGRTPTRVIEHGVVVPDHVAWTGEKPRGLVVINNLRSRGRRLGLDVFERARGRVPLDLIGMDATSLGGLGEVAPPRVPAFASGYRFFFNPIRYTSLGLAVCEAMMIGMPIVGLATTEMVTVVEDGVSGLLDTNVDRLLDGMRELVVDRNLAARLGRGARNVARAVRHRAIRPRLGRDLRHDGRFVEPRAGRAWAREGGVVRTRMRIAMISEHASPLAPLGGVDGGGQNVYVGQLARQLAGLGHEVDVFTRRDAAGLPRVVEWADGVRIVHVPAGPPGPLPKVQLLSHMAELTAFVIRGGVARATIWSVQTTSCRPWSPPK